MIIDKIKEMGANLKMLEGHDRLHYLIDKAKDLEPLPESAKTEANRIHGCASKLWLIGGMREDGTGANLTVDSFTPLGIKELLTIQRQNGLGELIDRIIRIAND